MKILGIITEFNPFHNGHKYFLEKVKTECEFDAIVCVMSGSFTQRGEPAICNKWSRAEMALENGVDLVIELPFTFASRSAHYFAYGAVQLLERTGVISHLAFGSEINNLTTLEKISRLLNHEPNEYKAILTAFLAKGLSYPVARSQALQEFFNDPNISEVLIGSNNILGIEYLRSLAMLNSPIIPLTIKRKGSSFHSSELSEYASATAIRSALYNNISLEELNYAMPLTSKNILAREISNGRAPIGKENLETAILAKLRTMEINDIEKLYDVIEGLESRIADKSVATSHLEELILAIKSKRYSYTRINRILLYSLFNFTRSLVDELDTYGPLYHHILGFTNQGIKVLGLMKEKSAIPILNRGKDVKLLYDQTNTPAGQMIKLDVMATNLYNLFYPSARQRIGASDFTKSPVKYLGS